MKEETLKPLKERLQDIVQSEEMDAYDKLGEVMTALEVYETPLSLGQFIPCKDGKPVGEPLHIYSDSPKKEVSKMYQEALKEYQQAEAKVLFKGWEKRYDGASIIVVECGEDDLTFSKESGLHKAGQTIESISHLNLILTDYGKEQIL